MQTTQVSNASHLSIQQHQHVALISIDRTEVENAVSLETLNQLLYALKKAEAETDTRVVLFTGSSGSFCSGFDSMCEENAGKKPDFLLERLTESSAAVAHAIRALKIPVIAAVDGAAWGAGLDLALACDLRLASTRAKFTERSLHTGIIPDGSAVWRLQHLIGEARTKEMVFSGKSLDARTALSWGLVNEVLEDTTLDENKSGKDAQIAFRQHAITYALNLAQHPKHVLSISKQAIHQASSGNCEDAIRAFGLLRGALKG